MRWAAFRRRHLAPVLFWCCRNRRSTWLWASSSWRWSPAAIGSPPATSLWDMAAWPWPAPSSASSPASSSRPGPLSVPAFAAHGLVKGAFIATEAAGSLALYISKAITFQHFGALPTDILIKGLISGSSVMAGTYIARMVVERLSTRVFQRLLDIVMAVAGLVLLASRPFARPPSAPYRRNGYGRPRRGAHRAIRSGRDARSRPRARYTGRGRAGRTFARPLERFEDTLAGFDRDPHATVGHGDRAIDVDSHLHAQRRGRRGSAHC
jgi:hypothetical protein